MRLLEYAVVGWWCREWGGWARSGEHLSKAKSIRAEPKKPWNHDGWSSIAKRVSVGALSSGDVGPLIPGGVWSGSGIEREIGFSGEGEKGEFEIGWEGNILEFWKTARMDEVHCMNWRWGDGDGVAEWKLWWSMDDNHLYRSRSMGLKYTNVNTILLCMITPHTWIYNANNGIFYIYYHTITDSTAEIIQTLKDAPPRWIWVDFWWCPTFARQSGTVQHTTQHNHCNLQCTHTLCHKPIKMNTIHKRLRWITVDIVL